MGRATEMGRPMLFNTGNGDFTAAPTLAAMGVLGHVAQTAGEDGIQGHRIHLCPRRHTRGRGCCEGSLRRRRATGTFQLGGYSLPFSPRRPDRAGIRPADEGRKDGLSFLFRNI